MTCVRVYVHVTRVFRRGLDVRGVGVPSLGPDRVSLSVRWTPVPSGPGPWEEPSSFLSLPRSTSVPGCVAVTDQVQCPGRPSHVPNLGEYHDKVTGHPRLTGSSEFVVTNPDM